MLSWLVILVIAGFMVMIGIRITPVYLEHLAIKESLQSIKDEPFISRKPVREIRKMLLRRLEINNIRHLSKDNVTLQRSGGVTTIKIAYEERRPVVANISLVMTFEDSIELVSN